MENRYNDLTYDELMELNELILLRMKELLEESKESECMYAPSECMWPRECPQCGDLE